MTSGTGPAPALSVILSLRRSRSWPPTLRARPLILRQSDHRDWPRTDASTLAREAAERLWKLEGRECLEYLKRRGLTDETVKVASLGAIESTRIPTKDGTRSYPVSGVSIPWRASGHLRLLKVRQLDGREPRYAEAFRDRPVVYPAPEAFEPGRPLIVCEGELDALLLAQQLPEASVITLGSASGKPDGAVLSLLLAASPWYVAHDADPAGDRAAAEWPATAIRVRPPGPGKDWGDVHAAGECRIRYHWGRLLNHSLPWSQLTPKGGLE
ncbi:MAG: toprim domain-containing protein [Isosphaeraceae bacterium]